MTYARWYGKPGSLLPLPTCSRGKDIFLRARSVAYRDRGGTVGGRFSNPSNS